jgi:hypothetical protein
MLTSLEPVAPPQHTQETLLADVLPWLILLLGLVIAGGFVIFWVRRSLGASASTSSADTGFTLHELRELLQKGEISNEEFERARAAIIGRFQKKSDREDESQPPPASDNAVPP